MVLTVMGLFFGVWGKRMNELDLRSASDTAALKDPPSL